MRRARGFSLVELMIAMAVGLVLVAAVTVLFAGTREARSELEKTGRMFDNGRHAQDLLAEDLRLAGYYGELPLLSANTSIPDVCATDPAALGWSATAPLAVPAPVVGYRDATGVPACLPDRLAGTDVVVVRRVSTALTPLASLDGASAYLQTSRCIDDTASFALGLTAAALPLRTPACNAQVGARRFLVRAYYVSRCNDCSRDTTPTLKRVELRGNQLVTVPLVEGIEDLRVDYGFDTDGDGSPDRLLRGPSGTAGAADNDWGNVMSVQVSLLVRTAELPKGHADDGEYALGLSGSVGPFRDGWKRTAFASAVRLNNPAGRRE